MNWWPILAFNLAVLLVAVWLCRPQVSDRQARRATHAWLRSIGMADQILPCHDRKCACNRKASV